MLDDARDRVKPRRKRLRVGDRAKGAIEDQMPAIGDEGRADFYARRYFALQPKFARRRLDMQPRRPGAKAVDLDRQRKGAERFDALAGVGDDDHAFGRRRDDFFAHQRAAAALDEPQRVVEFIGAIDGEIEIGTFVQRREL
jgi:hypothetical protein